jgi:glutathione S-transferase
MKLYFSRNPNPRLAVAVARFLDIDIAFEFASPMAPGNVKRFRELNPNLLVPILEHSGRTLWEADAIACWLSRHAGSDFWRTDDDLPDMIRWISWGKDRFVKACDAVHWERGTKLRYGIGTCDEAMVEEGIRQFHSAAAILDRQLADRSWLLGETISFADFRMATFLPYNDAARLPIETYPAIQRWNDRLNSIEGWADPFRGLEAPDLPPVPALTLDNNS